MRVSPQKQKTPFRCVVFFSVKEETTFLSLKRKRNMTHVIMFAATINLCLIFNSHIFFILLVLFHFFSFRFGEESALTRACFKHILIKKKQQPNPQFQKRHCNHHLGGSTHDFLMPQIVTLTEIPLPMCLTPNE